VESPEWVAVVNSEQFINEIGDAMAALAFLHFGVRSWKEDYTGYSPIWLLSYALPLWAAKIEEITGWGLSALLNEPKEYEIPWFPCDYVTEAMANVVDQVIFEQRWRPIINATKQMPCEEHFTPWRDSRVRKDWFRKWDHTRAKLKTVSLEEELEDGESRIHQIGEENNVYHFTRKIETEDFIERFKRRLKDRDREIFELRLEGYTYASIAEQLGYSNHSGVLKRMKVIQKAYIEYDSLP
jgi:hypothetical protein